MEEKNKGETLKAMEVEKDKDAQKLEEEALGNIEEDDDDFEDFEVEGKCIDNNDLKL
jgi:hypothetical protein